MKTIEHTRHMRSNSVFNMVKGTTILCTQKNYGHSYLEIMKLTHQISLTCHYEHHGWIDEVITLE